MTLGPRGIFVFNDTHFIYFGILHSSSSAAVVSGCACGANSDGASGSRETVVAAGVAGVAGLLALDGFEVFFRASSRAAFAAASISALAEASVDWSWMCAPVKSTNY